MIKSSLQNCSKAALVIILLYLFLVSIGLMSAAFKGFGKNFAEALLNATTDPFVALFIGILATSIIQSSSTTTSIIVGMVSSGVISVANAVPIIMGANIGTTVTNMLVSLGHITRREEFKRAIAGAAVHDLFNLICVAILFPLELATGFLRKFASGLANIFANCGGIKFTSPIKIATQPAVHFIKVVFIRYLSLPERLSCILILMVSVIILFSTLYFIVKLMKSLVIKKTEGALDDILGKSGAIAILAGLFFTIIVQSSSITTSLLIPLVGAGILSVEAAFPITIGANIGTTSTAILASFATGNLSAVTIAFVHFSFNLVGLVLLYPIKVFRNIPISLAKALGNLSFRKRRYALLYVAGIFFLIPAIIITVSRLVK